MNAELFSWLVTVVGLFGFWLAGNKVWWAWYVNIANQVMWVIFAVVSGYYAFLLGTAFYLFVFVKNAIQWTREHNEVKRFANMPVVAHNGAFDHDLVLPPYNDLDVEYTAAYYDTKGVS